MIKEALQYIVGLNKAEVQEFYNKPYSDKPLYRVKQELPKAEPLRLSTLTGLIDYIKADVEDEISGNIFIQVTSPTRIDMYSTLDIEHERERLVEVDAIVPIFPFGRFVEQEEFCINVQSKFINTENRELLLKFAGTVESGTIAQYGDDGVTQKATIKTGIASKGTAVLPSPLKLKLYRTFTEVEQPESDFIFRMKDMGGVSCALFEADGKAWRNVAMYNIKVYLQEQLKDCEHITVLA